MLWSFINHSVIMYFISSTETFNILTKIGGKVLKNKKSHMMQWLRLSYWAYIILHHLTSLRGLTIKLYSAEFTSIQCSDIYIEPNCKNSRLKVLYIVRLAL